MKLSDITKDLDFKKEENRSGSTNSKTAPKRRYFWDEEIPQPKLNQTATKVKAELKPQLKPKLNQTAINGLNAIVGLQRQIMDIFFQYCVNNGSTNTGNIFIEEIARKIKTTSPTVRTAIQRLEKKGCIIRSLFKNGRGGFSIYEIPTDMYQEWILNSRVKPNLNQTEIKVKAELKPQPKPDLDIKKESNYLELNNTYIQENFPSVQKIGFKESHLQKTARTESEIIEILTHYEHSLSMNEIRVPQKLPVLISIINDSNKTWVSESYLKTLNEELDANQRRVEQMSAIKQHQKETKRRENYQEYLTQNPNFKAEVLAAQPFKNLNEEVLETICFEEFKTKNPNF